MEKKLTDKQLFKWKNECLGERYGAPVSPMEFYRDLFPEGVLEERGDLQCGRPNMIVTSGYKKSREEIERIKEKEAAEKAEYERKRAAGEFVVRPRRYKRRWAQNTIVFDDLSGLEDLLCEDNELLEFVIIPPVAFSGKNRTLENAYHLWGFTIDLDGVEQDQLLDLIHQIDNDVIPEPTYIANSGHGMHVYYLFEDCIPMYPRLQDQLKELKKALTDVVWNVYTSTIPVDRRQYQSIVQGYRAVGSPSKLGKRYPVTAFRVGAKHTLRYLMEWAETERGIDFNEFTHVTLDEAKERWTEWYQRRVVEGKERERFYFPKGVYDSWKKRMEFGAFDGNRYNCVAVLFSLAIRCQVEFDDVLSDAMDMVPKLNRLTRKQSNEFTEDDVLDATSFYDEAFFNLGLKKVYRMTKIHIEPAKRNGRKRADHLRRARALQASDDPDGKWREGNGRPSAEQTVREYREKNPEARKADCIRDTGLSKPTVYKWWDGEPVQDLKPKKVQKQNLEWKFDSMDSSNVESVKGSAELQSVIRELISNIADVPDEERKKLMEAIDNMEKPL